ncbi:lipid-binding SYLF domain-containing protein [Flagellimonas sp. HMM57]|uniref:lipid-binding SYLF domain-containing protein n=1 Tax=unclassified Flagellimonas TaxID=2644544 RepID=UPI0013D06527|nr:MULTISPECIES: lipid-binding SYLF domain-containing protein [unclassified Flagellimonas]UII77761.1 lipid-binding SYLF domain-containing protein [Flagellimonas sp. HMM57]
MKVSKSITVVAMILTVTLSMAQTKTERKLTKDAVKAKQVLLAENPELDTLFENSAGYVIFPNVGKAGFIFGGAAGRGVLVENKMLSGTADMKKVNIGLQAGVQAMAQVLFFETTDSLSDFKEGNFEFGAQASLIALKSGLATNVTYQRGVSVFVMPKSGLMMDASIGGQKFNYKAL